MCNPGLKETGESSVHTASFGFCNMKRLEAVSPPTHSPWMGCRSKGRCKTGVELKKACPRRYWLGDYTGNEPKKKTQY